MRGLHRGWAPCAALVLVVGAWANPLAERVRGLRTEMPAEWRSVGPGGGGWIQSLCWSRFDTNRLFVGCDVGGFYYSEDAGRHYEMRNRGLRNMFIETIAEHPTNPDVLFLGSPGGIYKTCDRGRTWQEKRTGLPPVSASSHTVQISKFAFHPVRPDVVYAAVGQPRTQTGARGEIWRSDDAGESWRMVVTGGLAKDVNVFDLAFNATNGASMLLTSNRGVFRSEDGGCTWAPSNAGLPAHRRTRRLAWSPSDPRVVYVSLRQKGGEAPWSAGVYRSDDGGRSWQARTVGIPQRAGRPGCDDNLCTWTDGLAVDPRNPDVAWTGGAAWWCTGIFKTVDGGRSWRDTFPARRPGWITFWGPAATCLALSPLDPARVAFGTSGMVYATEDGGAGWAQRYCEERADGTFAGTGLEVTCLHTVVPSRHRPGRVYLGYFDIGLLVTDDAGRSFRRAMVGVPSAYSNSCFSLAEAPDDPQRLWAGFGSWGGGGTGCVATSVDGGATWTPCTNAASGWVDAPARDLVVLGAKPRYRVLYAGRKGLVTSVDGGATWTGGDTAACPVASRVRTFAVAGDRLVAGVAGTDAEPAAVYAGTLDGAGWRRLTPPALRLGEIRRVVVEGSRILVTARAQWRARTREMRPGGAWLSVDGGATWKRVLADAFCDAALVSRGELFVALSDHPYHDHSVGGGVVHSRDDGATWTVLDGPQLQNWNASALALDPFDPRMLWVGTGGNSVFVGTLRR